MPRKDEGSRLWLPLLLGHKFPNSSASRVQTAFGFPWGTWKLFTAAGDSCPLHGQWTNYANAPNSEALSGRLLHFCKPLHALLKQFVSNNLLSLLLPQHLLQVHEALTAASQLPYSHPTITKGFPHPPCPRRKQSHSFPKPCKQEQQQNLYLNQKYVDWKIFRESCRNYFCLKNQKVQSGTYPWKRHLKQK